MKFTSLVFLLPLILLFASCAGESDYTVIDGATLIDVTTGVAQPNSRVILEGGIIHSTSPDASIPRGADIIDASGKFLIPGLSDMHVHFSLGLPRPRVENETQIVLDRLLYYGVTSVLNLGASDGSSTSIKNYRTLIASDSLVAPNIYGTGGHINIPGTHPIETIFPQRVRDYAASALEETPLDSPANLEPIGIGISLVRTTEAARAAVRERATNEMDAIKITLERGPTEFGNHHPLMPDSIIGAIVSEASKYELPVFAHVSSLDELDAALRNGVSGTVHAVAEPPFPAAERMTAIQSDGFIVMPTLALYEAFIQYLEDETRLEDPFLRESVTENEIAIFRESGFLEYENPDSLAFWRTLNNLTLANIGEMHSSGIRIVAGTDVGNPMVFAGWSIHQELEKLVEAGLTPAEALATATINAAAMIGEESTFGSIEPGKRADILILEKNPLEDISNTRSIQDVIVRGEVVMRDSLVLSF